MTTELHAPLDAGAETQDKVGLTLRQEIDRILNEHFGDKPIPSATAEATKRGRITVIRYSRRKCRC